MNKYLLIFLFAVVSVLALILISTKFEPFVKVKNFPTGNNLISMNEDGDISLIPSKNVDDSINDTAESITRDTKSKFDSITRDANSKFQTKNSAAEESLYTQMTFQNKKDARKFEDFARDRYQPKGDYVKRATNYSIKMGPGNRAGGTHYMVGTSDNWRVAYNGGSGSKWQFV